MKTSIILLFAVAPVCLYAQDKPEKSDKADSLKIIQLLADDYKTLATYDVAKHKSNCASDYLLIEDGKILTLKQELENYKSNAGNKVERKDNFLFKTVKVYDKAAYAVYELFSEVTKNGEVKNYHWAESAVFHKKDKEWKIKLIHSKKLRENRCDFV